MTYDEDLLKGGEIELEAKTENLHQATDFVESFLEKAGCSMKALMQINIAVDEIFTNISAVFHCKNFFMVRMFFPSRYA